MMKMRSVRYVALVLLLSGVAVAAQENDWDDLYKEAVAHVARREWKLAEDKLLQAVKGGPPSGRGVIRRGIFRRDEDYFPEFYLGIVYLNTDRPEQAVAQFKVARARGVNVRDDEFRRLPELEANAAVLAEAEAERKALQDLRQAFTTGIEQARRLLAQERFDEAAAAATRAHATNVDRAAADDLLRTIEQRRAEDELRRRLGRSPGPVELRRMLEEYADAGISLDEVRKRIAAAEAVERRAAAERQAMIEFFSGSYQRSIGLLAEAEKALPLTVRGLFYRAASLASLAIRGRKINEAQLGLARRAWAAANEQPDAFKADLPYISPEILRLLRGGSQPREDALASLRPIGESPGTRMGTSGA